MKSNYVVVVSLTVLLHRPNSITFVAKFRPKVGYVIATKTLTLSIRC